MSEEAVQSQPVESGSNEGASAPIEGGVNPISFDQLENIQNEKTRSEQLKPVKQEKSAAKQKNETKIKQPVVHDDEPKSSLKKQAKEVTKSKQEQLEPDQESSSEVVSSDSPPKPTIKLKNGDQDIELYSDAPVPVKIDGEVTEVPFEEVVRSYSGQRAIQKRFSEYARIKQDFDRDKQEVDSFLDEVMTRSKTDPIEALVYAAQRTGSDPIEYRKALLDNLADHAIKWSQMDDKEREMYTVQMENEQLKQNQQSFQSQQQQQQQLTDLDTKVQQIEKDLGVNRETFAKHYFELESLAKEGKIKQEITPEIVADYISDQEKVGIAGDILESIDPQLARQQDAIDDVVEIMYDYPQLDAHDLIDIVKEHYTVTKPSQKVTQKLSKGKPDQVEPARKLDGSQAPITFDELDRLL